MGKKPDALLRSLVYRLGEVTAAQKDKVAEAAPNATKQAIIMRLEALQEFGQKAGDDTVKPQLRSTRCFKVKTKSEAEGDKIRWIFAANAEPKLMDLLHELRELKALECIGLVLGYDHAPRSQAAKLVDQLMFGGKAKSKGKGNNNDEEEGDRYAAKPRR